jgi:hypothetical protein
MSFVKNALLGAVLVSALGGAVYAQGDGGSQQLSNYQLMINRVFVVTPDGKVVMRTVEAPEMQSEILKEARPMSAGSILIMRDNKVYATPDRPTQGGIMLSEAIARMPVR